jgi:peptidoglycan/LPS O-acetylase OafA/YrhL
MPFRFDSFLYPILIAAIFTLISAVWALLFMTDHISFGPFFGTRALLFLGDILVCFFASRRRKEKRRKVKSTRFSK